MLSAGLPLAGGNHHLFRHRHNFHSFKPITPTSFIIRSSSLQELNTSSSLEASDDDDDDGKLSSVVSGSVSFPAIKVAKRVVLVRHGQSTWNAEGRIQGSSDFSILTKKGEAQAETSRQMLIDDSFDICFSSPLKRSKRTADVIWDARKEEILTDSDLREIDLYSFQGLLKNEGIAKYGEAFGKWQKDAPNFNIDGHYPVRELWDRASSCWQKILVHDSRSVLVVAHNAVNQALVATAMGLGTEYFRILLQSNCGVSVLDFVPRPEGGSPYICLNRLNQTPGSPIGGGSSAGRKASRRIVLVCHGSSQASNSDDTPMDMLGTIQSQKTAELLLDLKVKSIVSSPRIVPTETANSIARVQEAADCLGADCVPRYVETKQLKNLDFQDILNRSKKESINASSLQFGWMNEFEDGLLTEIWDRSGTTWKSLLDELSNESQPENVVVVVGHPIVNIGLLGHCLNLTKDWLGSFHLDAGSISVIDFPDGPFGRGVVRCINYTAHLGRWSIPITRPTQDEDEF
uniref:probable 2-carboxy-D-arabinitol-1-phosphatase n=1 Tax=Erigeron canadensis TaxID=72917 RepID=UPI001CB8FD64|nr:probable 2-carboxy-D-arabinitol-1-phosphatase [Erigeron canadensis]